MPVLSTIMPVLLAFLLAFLFWPFCFGLSVLLAFPTAPTIMPVLLASFHVTANDYACPFANDRQRLCLSFWLLYVLLASSFGRR
jgi:hypothetical protein